MIMGVAALKHEVPEPESSALRWYVVCSRPLQERVAERSIRFHGFDVYLPLRAAVGHEKLRMKDAPLFSRYLFARLDVTQPRWRLVLTAPGVAMLIYAAGQLASVPDSVIDELRARERGGMIHLEPRPSGPSFQPGDAVQVPRAGRLIDAIVSEMVDDARIRVLFTMFGRPVKAVLPLTSIAAGQGQRHAKK